MPQFKFRTDLWLCVRNKDTLHTQTRTHIWLYMYDVRQSDEALNSSVNLTHLVNFHYDAWSAVTEAVAILFGATAAELRLQVKSAYFSLCWIFLRRTMMRVARDSFRLVAIRCSHITPSAHSTTIVHFKRK